MSDDLCACCGTTAEQQPATDDTEDIETVTLDTTLPSDLQAALAQFLDCESIRTLGEWADAIRQQTGGGAISREDLCHVDEKTGHWGDLDGERYHFACFYDAIILAGMADRRVDIRTESPDGTVIEARAVGQDELSVSPPDAVFSIGVDETVVAADEEPSIEESYAAICPHVKAFPDRAAYEEWAADVPAATAAMPLAGATDLAEALVAE